MVVPLTSETSAPPAPRPRPWRRAGAVAELTDRLLGSLTEAELIARVLAGPEPAGEVVKCAATLARIPFWERRSLGAAGLVSEHRVPPHRAVRLAALWELAARWYPDDRPSVASPRDALLVLERLRRAPRERVVVLLLDSRSRLLGEEVVAVGTLNASRFRPVDVLGPALKAGATAIVLAHNHPSGDPTPSRPDRTVTETLRRATELVGVTLVDHLVIGQTGHYSFREAEGWSQPVVPGL